MKSCRQGQLNLFWRCLTRPGVPDSLDTFPRNWPAPPGPPTRQARPKRRPPPSRCRPCGAASPTRSPGNIHARAEARRPIGSTGCGNAATVGLERCAPTLRSKRMGFGEPLVGATCESPDPVLPETMAWLQPMASQQAMVSPQPMTSPRPWSRRGQWHRRSPWHRANHWHHNNPLHCRGALHRRNP